jgi:hypothetical protein
MRASHLNGSLVVAALFGLALGVRLVVSPLVHLAALPVTRAHETASATAAAPSLDSSDSSGGVLVMRDPFRVARRPARAFYDPLRLSQAAIQVQPRPTLALAGIVWDGGGDPSALIEGIPGSDGPLALRRGQAAGGVRVRQIVPDRVTVVGLDTTWVLVVKEPWK